MDAQSYVPTPGHWFGCNTGRLSASYVCNGCSTAAADNPKVFINPEIIKKSDRVINVILKGVYQLQANKEM